jgi:hypothetical protein
VVAGSQGGLFAGTLERLVDQADSPPDAEGNQVDVATWMGRD